MDLREPRAPFATKLFSAEIILAVVFAVLNHFQVAENDVFWQARAGEEILSNLSVQRFDTWSHTHEGAPWTNFQWLATVLTYLVSTLRPGYFFIPTFRSLLVFISTLLSARLLTGRPQWMVWFFVPLTYIICAERYQFRPELFVFPQFIALILIWTRAVSFKARIALTYLILIASSNLHSPLQPVLLVVSSAFILFDSSSSRLRLGSRLALAAGACATWFVNPIGFDGVKGLLTAMREPELAMIGATEHAPFSIHSLTSAGAAAVWFWLALTVFTVVGYAANLRNRCAFPGAYRSPAFFALVTLALTAVALLKLRLRVYQTIFLLPVATVVMAALAERLRHIVRKQLRKILFASTGLLFFGVIFNGIDGPPLPIGFGVLPGRYPARAVEFIKKTNPLGQIENAYNYGGYLVDRLREYKVAVDGRELPFIAWLKDRAETKSTGTAEAYEQFRQRYGINMLLIELPPVVLNPDRQFVDTYSSLAPISTWALVFADDSSALYVRRIPEHEELIRQYEYKHLFRGLPAEFGAKAPNLTDELRVEFRKELERCLLEAPGNKYCRDGIAAYSEVTP